MKLIKKILLETGKLVLFLLLMVGFVYEASEFIQLKRSEKAFPSEGQLIEKEVVRGLFGSMSYFATISNKDEVLDYSVELTKRQYEELTPRDAVQGILKKGQFHSAMDVKQETFKNWIMMIVYGFYPFFYVFHLLRKLDSVDAIFYRYNKPLDRAATFLLIGAWFLMLLIFYGTIGKAVYNAAVTYSGELIETEAYITDGYVSPGGRLTAPTYHLSFKYLDTDGHIRHMSKQMLRSDFVQPSSTMTIRFPKDRPEYVSVPGYSWKDGFSLLQTAEMLQFALALGMTGLTVYLIYFMIKKKKEEQLKRVQKQQKQQQRKKRKKRRRK